MRLYSPLSRRVEELPTPPGPIRMYFCGPTVYARAHVGNARPFVLGIWLRTWLRLRGYEATLVHNITDINDKIYDAAPGASADLARRATDWYLEDTADLGLGMPDELPRATEDVPQIVRVIEQLVDRGAADAVEGGVYFRVVLDPGGDRPLGPRDRAAFLHDCALVEADRLLRRDHGAGARAARHVPERAPCGLDGAGRPGGARGRAGRRLQHARRPRGPPPLAVAG